MKTFRRRRGEPYTEAEWRRIVRDALGRLRPNASPSIEINLLLNVQEIVDEDREAARTVALDEFEQVDGK